ncbi:class I adenylate-forming enzyme family protein [Mycolicibacter sinensis]|uniref:AMP-dependent synthetase n=1 Tax=Mycolicibacter sinensis (strain JDM601) TaxID=875328 RepID=A0A1A2ECQ0_MYCSD|nr:fatty acid--CoA ligase family protein [Mycolicibacter sinensis]OBG02556.1 AMP-dependent synthetase [Mycolicibacter sinensis]OBG03073.1 AMP-dependent synthetase [Mycolicibacter sinensis]
MTLSVLLEMASGDADRVAVVDGQHRWSVGHLSGLAGGGAGVITASAARTLVYVGLGGALLPALLFSAARAAVPFCPLNYRLGADGLNSLLARLPAPLVVTDPQYRDAVDADSAVEVLDSAEFLRRAAAAEQMDAVAGSDDMAVILFTSGTTARPKAVELSHDNLFSYVTGTVEFGSAEAQDAALVCVPPYHIAGVGAVLSSLYAGRRLVYLPTFDPTAWIALIDAERVTSATVVPTMLDRIVSVLERRPAPLSSLRTLAYGGSRVPLPLVRKALALLPHVGFVNAYGLTETSSTVAVLTPEDHWAALDDDDEDAARRLGSVGRPVPGIEVQIRDERGRVLTAGGTGELYLRGSQVSGRYAEIGSVLDAEGWFPTKDLATIDEDGYLFVHGRSDDTIIRGGENIAPAELEDVLVEHPSVHQVAVVGADDPEWGQIIVAVVVTEPNSEPDVEDLRDWVRSRLRGSRTPDRVVFRDELPVSPTGKILRRELTRELNEGPTAA